MLPAIPEAKGALDLHVVTDTCVAIETWAKTADDVAALRDAKNKLAAIDEYMALTSRDGRAAVAATMRRLEVRIGQLLGPAEPTAGPGRGKPSNAIDGLSRDERSAMRTLAANEDIVEQVIAESTDEAPASRRKVVEAIKVPGRKVYSRCWRSFPANGSVVVFAAWLLARIDRAQAFAFFDAMVDKDLKGKGDPRSALLKRFESMQRNGEKVSVVTQADWIFRAWNAHRKGQRMDLLKYQSGAFTEPK